MNVIATLPAIVRVLIVFFLILIAIKKKVPLGHAFIGGAALIGLLFGLPAADIGLAALRALILPKTLSLAVVVCLILVFSHSLEATGQMQRLLANFRGLVRRPLLNLVIFPSLIGLLPMPGGAVFSAPMVKNIGEGHGLSGAQLSYTNYWFRHIWEYWWPLYPGVLLTTALAGIDLWVFMAYALPVSAVAAAAGYWPLRRSLGVLPADPNGGVPRAVKIRAFVKELFPILLVIVAGIGTGTLLEALLGASLDAIHKELGLIVALFAAIGWVWRQNAFDRRERLKILKLPELRKMFYMVAAILIFKGLLTDSGAVARISEELLRWRIPLVPVVMLLPFVVGMVAGISIAFVGTTFPILISLIQTLGQAHLMLPFMVFGIVCGFVGVLFSPLHLCLILSNTYFKTTLTAVYRLMWFPLLALFAGSGLYFLLSRAVMGG